MTQRNTHHQNTLSAQKKTIVIDIIPPDKTADHARQEIDELCRLVETYGGIVILEVLQKRGRPSSKTYLGEGKAADAAEKAKSHKVDMVIINGFLKPAQSTNLRKLFSHDPNDLTGQKDIPIWDRTDIILKIFEKHAKSQKALLQIKLAQLKHQIPKIYQYQTKLFDKERGGISGTRGAGEKGVEQEKRHIRNQIKEVEDKLEAVKKTHVNQRERRKKNGLKTVALVGYTNAGKSTLLKSLTKKETYIADELFATLDTKLGSMWIPDEKNPWKGEKILIADTIGFIQNLPPHLINSFKATLDEVQEADLILHVIDSSDPEQLMKIKVVDDILKDLVDHETEIVRIFNKSDQQTFCILEQKNEISISAEKKVNFESLKSMMASQLKR
jgi:GTP-binding protein HflX